MVNALAEIVDKNEYEILAKKLNIDLEVAQSIKFIEAEQLMSWIWKIEDKNYHSF